MKMALAERWTRHLLQLAPKDPRHLPGLDDGATRQPSLIDRDYIYILIEHASKLPESISRMGLILAVVSFYVFANLMLARYAKADDGATASIFQALTDTRAAHLASLFVLGVVVWHVADLSRTLSQAMRTLLGEADLAVTDELDGSGGAQLSELERDIKVRNIFIQGFEQAIRSPGILNPVFGCDDGRVGPQKRFGTRRGFFLVAAYAIGVGLIAGYVLTAASRTGMMPSWALFNWNAQQSSPTQLVNARLPFPHVTWTHWNVVDSAEATVDAPLTTAPTPTRPFDHVFIAINVVASVVAGLIGLGGTMALSIFLAKFLAMWNVVRHKSDRLKVKYKHLGWTSWFEKDSQGRILAVHLAPGFWPIRIYYPFVYLVLVIGFAYLSHLLIKDTNIGAYRSGYGLADAVRNLFMLLTGRS